MIIIKTKDGWHISHLRHGVSKIPRLKKKKKNTQVEFSLLSLYYKVYVLSGWFAGCLLLTLTNWWNLFSVFEGSFPILQLKILKFIVISVMSSYTFTWILDKFPRFGEGLYIFETHIAPLNDLII